MRECCEEGSLPLVGRDDELRQVRDLIAGIGERGASLLVVGEAGIGKSSILAEATRSARERGLTVLAATGIQAETQLTCSGLHQLLRPIIDRIEDLPTPQGNALRAAFGMTSEAAPDIFLTALATLEMLSDVAQSGPIVVVADDAQWLDRATSDVLAFVSRRLEAEPIVLLAAIRDGFDSPLRSEALGEMRLGRLTPESAARVLDGHTSSLSVEDRATVLRQAIGNPLALVELAHAVAASDGEDVAFSDLSHGPALTERLERAFSARVTDLPPATQRFLLVAALDDDDGLPETLRAATVLESTSKAEPEGDVLAPAIEAKVITVEDGTISFRHPLIRSAIAQSATLLQRSAAHSALADLMVDQPDRRIWHRAAASLGPDEGIAVDLEAAADRAVRQGSPAVAIAALERAARLSVGTVSRGARLLHAAELAFELGRYDWMGRILSEVRPLDAAALERRRRSWVLALSLRGPVTAMEGANIGAAIEAVEGARRDHDVDLALNLLTLIASRCWWVVPDDTIMRRLVEAAERLGLRQGDPNLLHTQALTPVERGSVVLAELERHARAGLDDPAAARLLGTVAVWMGAFDLAADFLVVAVEGLRREGRLGLLARALVSQAWVAVQLGTWSVAVPAAEEGLRLAAETGQPFFPTWAQETQALIAAARGDAARVESLLATVERDAVQFASPAMMQIVVHARGSAALAAGRHDEAFAQLRRLNDPSDPSFHPVGQGWAVADLAEAAIGSGHIDDVRPIVADLERVARTMPSRWLHIGLRHARAVLAADAAAEGLFQAALDADLTRWPLARARLQLAYGSWLRRQRRVAESRAPLRAARDGFDALGLTSWAERARQELRASGEASRSRSADAIDHLTPQELQIAQLAARGLSNREIGQQLYLSHRTVGFHLYRIFPKLDVTSRAQLGAALATGRLAPVDA
jgi:DNA-binding CsgD family transcriptional regulator